jgi:hypothetical protein
MAGTVGRPAAAAFYHGAGGARAGAVGGGADADPGPRPGLALALAGLFLAWLGLRLASTWIKPRPAGAAAALPAHELPVYTVIAALYREACSVAGLLAAIERLDYPPEKLDVVIAVEADDRGRRKRRSRPAMAVCRSRW